MKFYLCQTSFNGRETIFAFTKQCIGNHYIGYDFETFSLHYSKLIGPKWLEL